VACTESNELANPLKGFWNIVSKLKAAVRSKCVYPNKTVLPTREDWWWLSSPSSPWAPCLLRRYLSFGIAIHCRFQAEML